MQDTTKPTDEINRAYRRKLALREQPAAMTAADMVADEQVPMHIRLWLEDFITKGEAALTASFVAQDSATLAQARLIKDVLDSGGIETDECPFPPAALDYVQEYMYRLAKAAEFALWNLGDAAVAALPILLECAALSIEGTPSLIALETAIYGLTTAEERRYFFKGDRWGTNTPAERPTEAGYKLARLLANPQTTAETRARLDSALLEFAQQANINVTHAALAQRVFTLAADEMSQRRRGKYAKQETAHRRQVYNDLLALLDSLDG